MSKLRTLAKLLAKPKNGPTIGVSIRLTREVIEVLDDIEQTTSIRYDWFLRIMIGQFVKFWPKHKEITFPCVPVLLSLEEARRLGYAGPDEKGESPPKPPRKQKE